MTNPQSNGAVIELKWVVGDRVTVDGEIKGYVAEISIDFGNVIKFKVEWFHNGGLCIGWFHQHRLS